MMILLIHLQALVALVAFATIGLPVSKLSKEPVLSPVEISALEGREIDQLYFQPYSGSFRVSRCCLIN